MDPAQRRRFELLIEQFLERKRVAGWSPRTLDSYRSQLGFFLTYLDEETGVEEIAGVTPETLHGYQTHLYSYTSGDDRGLAVATQAARLSCMRSLFQWLVKIETLLYDPSAGLELPKRKRTLPRSVLTENEVARLLAVPDTSRPLGLRDRAMLELLYSTGIRNAELRALQVYDLDLERGVVRVIEGKNARDRIVPLGQDAALWIAEYIDEGRPKLLGKRAGEVETTVFVSKSGRRLAPLGVIYPVRKYARLAGIERPVTPHTFRHTFATHLLAGRADIRHIQAMLGHSSVATTQIYTRVEVTDLKEIHRRCHPREKR